MSLVAAKAIVSAARDTLSDATIPYRWSDDVMLYFLLDGEMLLVTNHPESQYDVAVTNSTPVLLAINGTTTVSDRWKMPLAHYLASRALSENVDAAEDMKKAASEYELFKAEAL
jgi:hypothetical protein